MVRSEFVCRRSRPAFLSIRPFNDLVAVLTRVRPRLSSVVGITRISFLKGSIESRFLETSVGQSKGRDGCFAELLKPLVVEEERIKEETVEDDLIVDSIFE